VAGDVSEMVEDVQRIVDAVGVEMLGGDYRDHEPPTLWAEIDPPVSR
jgi:hypothetical protein